MNDTINFSLNRMRNAPTEGSGIFYQGIDLTSLLLRDSKSFVDEDKRLLLECYTNYGREFFEKIALDNKIVPFVAHVFIDLNCDVRFWQEQHDCYVQRNYAIKALLESLFSEMPEYSVRTVTLTENFAVVLTSDACIGCFCSGDVDLSADICERDNIITWFKKFEFLSKDPDRLIGEYSGQSMQFYNAEAINGGFWINVIWKPVTRAFLIQGKYEIRLARDRQLALTKNNSSIRILDDTSLLYFCALHISAGHYFTLSPGLRLYVDIDRLARSVELNWDDIVNWEIEDDAGIRISMIMYLSSKILKTPIPEIFLLNIQKNRRSRRLLKYLYNEETKQIQGKSSIFRRLYIELASDNRNLAINFVSRVIKLIRSKFYMGNSKLGL
jgi:hypothetical protein